MTKKEKNRIKKLINQANSEIQYILNNKTWTQYGKELVKLCLDEEKHHGRMRPDYIKRGLTLSEAAKLFAVRRIVECLLGYIPDAASYHSMQKSIFLAYSLVCQYRGELTLALTPLGLIELSELDYAELQKECD